jgi:hypothetical protein
LNFETKKDKKSEPKKLCGWNKFNQLNILNEDAFLVLDLKDVKSKPINISGIQSQTGDILTSKG